jgi:hypothetical protein
LSLPRGVVVVSVVYYKGNVRGLLGDVPYGYDAIVAINFAAVKFVHIDVYNRHCHHSCNIKRLEVGIASRSAFGSPLRDEG